MEYISADKYLGSRSICRNGVSGGPTVLHGLFIFVAAVGEPTERPSNSWDATRRGVNVLGKGCCWGPKGDTGSGGIVLLHGLTGSKLEPVEQVWDWEVTPEPGEGGQ